MFGASHVRRERNPSNRKRNAVRHATPHAAYAAQHDAGNQRNPSNRNRGAVRHATPHATYAAQHDAGNLI